MSTDRPSPPTSPPTYGPAPGEPAAPVPPAGEPASAPDAPGAMSAGEALDMSDAAAPIRPPAPPRRRPARWLAALLALASIALAALLSLPFSTTGTRWLLAGLQGPFGLEVAEPGGALFGRDFSARSLRLPLTAQQVLVIDQPAWQGLQWQRVGGTSFGRIHIDRVSAARIDVQGPGASEPPLRLPLALQLPLAVTIDSIEVGELVVDAIRERPVQGLHARHLSLAAGPGAQHRLDELRLQWDRLSLSGRAELGAAAPLTLQASVQLRPRAPVGDTAAADAAPPGTPQDWQVDLQAHGPLTDLALNAELRARDQSLSAQARLQPEAALPLSRLSAQLRALDLAPLASGLPHTAVTGQIELALDNPPAGRTAQPLTVQARLRNDAAGALADGRAPLREVELKASGELSAPDQGRVETLRLLLGTAQAPAGTVDGRGRWALTGQGAARRIDIDLEARIDKLQPQRLHPASPALQIGGPLVWTLRQPWPASAAADAPGTTGRPAAAAEGFKTSLRTRLTGKLIGSGLPSVTLTLDAQAEPSRVHIADLQADAGGARLAGRGSLSRQDGNLLLKWKHSLQAFDPALWWVRPRAGAADSALDRMMGAGPHQLNGALEADLRWPAKAPRSVEGLAQLRGQARLDLQPSQWAGLPVAGHWQLNSNPSAASALPHVNTRVTLQVGAAQAPSTLHLQGELDPVGSRDHWQLAWNSADLQALTPWLRLVDPAQPPQLAGRTDGELQVDGRWPHLQSSGRVHAPELRWRAEGADRIAVQDLTGRWRVGNAASDPVEIDARIERAEAAGWQLRGLAFQVDGTGADHHLRLDLADAAQPRSPAAGAGSGTSNGQAGGSGPVNGGMPALSARLVAHGGHEHTPGRDLIGWQGQIDQLEVREIEARPSPATSATSATAAASAPAAVPLAPFSRPLRLVLDPTRVLLNHSPSATTVTLGATRAHIGDVHLALQEFAWQQDRSSAPPANRLALRSQLDAIDVAPLLRSLQPGFGWGGDLRIGGRIDVQATPERFNLEAGVQRDSGDLQVTDPDNPRNPQRLGLADLRVGLSARDGQWRLTQRVSGGNLGRLVGEQSVSTAPAAMWPPANTPVAGKIELQVAQLGNWGRWLPAGWRLSGQLETEARITGRLGAPELSGELVGRNLAVRNLLQGVDWHDAQLRVRLDGSTARVETASVRAGEGRLGATGEIQLGAAPRLDLRVSADKFAVLQRVDRRIVASGEAQLQLDARTTLLKGQLRADEGRIDFSQSDAPGLADDVDVQRPESVAARERAAAAARSQRNTVLDLRADLGPAFTLKGRGLATRLAGELRLTSPGNKLAIAGVIRAEDGNYAAYGQKLTVDRGLITFISAPDNPRLDIEATRPDLEDVRVGVTVTGTAQAPRIRLFSVPSMSDTDRLSWLLLGRASDGLGRTDLALLQRAAYALLAGESDSPSLVERIGLDELSVRQNETGDTRETVVTLGKQLSRRWFVGYERSLNAAAGTWQLIYRAAQRFTLRAQSGTENALDLIWTWKWGDQGQRVDPGR